MYVLMATMCKIFLYWFATLKYFARHVQATTLLEASSRTWRFRRWYIRFVLTRYRNHWFSCNYLWL